MKKVVLVLDGVVGKVFLNSVLEKYFSNNLYIVIVKDSAMIPEKFPSSFSFHNFDPTSQYHLAQVFDEHRSLDLSDVVVIMEDSKQAGAVFKIVRKICKEARIVTLSSIGDESLQHDDHAIFLDDAEIIAGQFISRLPNVPIIPRGFGLGQGEIMEVGVPFGSMFAYRHIGSIQQKNYKIVGIYRNNEFLLSTFSLVIQPQDVVLVAGDPKTLRNIYKQIKSDIGQFPSPFGRDIYVYVDMLAQDSSAIMRDITQAIYLHSLIRSTKLFIIVLNPADFATIYEIKELCKQDSSIMLKFDYANTSFIERLDVDCTKKIGLIIVGIELFAKKSHRKALYRTSTPVLKTAAFPLDQCKQNLVIINEEMNAGENISSVIFDIAIQMNIDIHAYDFEPDGRHQNAIIKDYEALGRSFGKKVVVTKTMSKNPIFYLQELKEPVLHFLPFEQCIARSRAFAFFSTKAERLSLLLNTHPQMLIPIGSH
ncbi:TrkA C-terminal domain-containing protein [Helicobacter sp.]|uniref:COG3400 family protein n=1 Tax=Helicobacter sp. TaxID=218 RepID=UPI0025C3D90D|nr:TrkA C-terminal domain-containing protein [Helicobacter sp.]MBR2495538.1 potassium transporter TrkA [Helicobacter sp.]